MSPQEYTARRQRLAAGVAEKKLDAMLVTDLVNVRYLTGFTGSNAMLLLNGGDTVLFTDPRYTLQAAGEVSCRVRIAKGPLLAEAAKTAVKRGVRRLGFEKQRLLWSDYEFLRSRLTKRSELTPLDGPVEELRLIKSDAEIDAIRRSVNLNSAAYANALKKLRAGMSEAELAAEIDHQMRLAGAEGSAFETIVAAGARTALPHARPRPERITANQLVLIDMGATLEGYASDMTRMVHLGRPGNKVRSLHRAVLEAQLAAIDAIRPGVAARIPDAAARKVLAGHGLAQYFTHSTGHGLGLYIHEGPRLGKKDKTKLQAGMVVTVEPGVYLEGAGGVRIEDTVLVTSGGHEILTPTSKDLTVV